MNGKRFQPLNSAVKWLFSTVLLLGLLLTAKDISAGTNGPVQHTAAPSGQSIDQILEKFSEEDANFNNEIATENSLQTQPDEIFQEDRVQLYGSLEIRTTYNFAHDRPGPEETDWRGLSSLVTEAELEGIVHLPNEWYLKGTGRAFYDFLYLLRDEDRYTDQVIDGHRSELDLYEFFLAGPPLPSVDLKLGRQIVVWGRADLLRITDVFNPLDLREMGLTDIEDLRLPLTMARLDTYPGHWNLTYLAVPEIEFNKLPGFGHDFYPSLVPLIDSKPASNFENLEYGAALNGIFSGWGISFYWADFYDDIPHGEQGEDGEIIQRHSRLTMLGTAVDVALSNVLLKAEVAHLQGLEFYDLPNQTLDRTDTMLGIEYNGLSNTFIGVEVANRHLHDYEQALKSGPENAERDVWQAGLQAERNYYKDTLTVSFVALALHVKDELGGYERLEFKYRLTDSVMISAGVVFYQSVSQTMFENIGDNDRLFIKLNYSF